MITMSSILQAQLASVSQTAVVGTSGSPVSVINANIGAGNTFIYVTPGTIKTRQTVLFGPIASSEAGFSGALSANELTLVVSARSANTSGEAYVYTRTTVNDPWVLLQTLQGSDRLGPGGGLSAQFGTASAITPDGNYIFIGANAHDGNNDGSNTTSPTDTGAVYIYNKSGANYGTLVSGSLYNENAIGKPSFNVTNGAFTISSHTMAATNDFLAIGALRNNGNASMSTPTTPSQSGSVFIFNRSGSVWGVTSGTRRNENAVLKASNADPSDFFGSGLAMRDNVLAVYSESEDSNESLSNPTGASGSGAVYIFTLAGSNWGVANGIARNENQILKANPATATSAFGLGVAILETEQTICAKGSGPSDLHFFEKSGATWGTLNGLAYNQNSSTNPPGITTASFMAANASSFFVYNTDSVTYPLIRVGTPMIVRTGAWERYTFSGTWALDGYTRYERDLPLVGTVPLDLNNPTSFVVARGNTLLSGESNMAKTVNNAAVNFGGIVEWRIITDFTYPFVNALPILSSGTEGQLLYLRGINSNVPYMTPSGGISFALEEITLMQFWDSATWRIVTST